MRNLALAVVIFFLPFSCYAIAPITGKTTLCVSGTTALSDATPGGTWSSSNTSIADVDATGLVSGLTVGTATITYTESASFVTTTVDIINPPVFTSSLTPPALCNAKTFNYTPASSTPGVMYTWSRAFLTGIYEVAGSGIDNPNEQLINTTYAPVTVTYVYTLTAGSCINTQTITLTVNPPTKLSSVLTADICSDEIFMYTPTSLTPGTTFAWVRFPLTGITPASGTGTGGISETLTNSTSAHVSVPYRYTLSANGCTNTTDETVLVTVHQLPCDLSVHQAFNTIESKIYPNPSNGTFSIRLISPVSEPVVFVINNIVGMKVKEVSSATNMTTDINLDVPAGIYLLSATTPAAGYYSKIIIDK